MNWDNTVSEQPNGWVDENGRNENCDAQHRQAEKAE